MTKNVKKTRRRFFSAARDDLQVFRHALRPFLLFELAYKLLTIGLFIPLISRIFNKMLEWSGYGAAANADILRFVFSRYGLITLIIIAPIAVLLIYIEFSVLIYIAYYGMQEKKVKIRAVLLKVFSQLPGFLRISSFGLTLYLLLLVPLLGAGFGSSLLPDVPIPNFITGELLKTDSGTLMMMLFFLVVIILNALCVYALPILVLEKTTRFWYAARKSCRIFWRSKWSLLKASVEWLLVFILAIIIFVIIFVLLFSLVPEDSAKVGILVQTVAVVISFGIYALTLFMTPMFITLMTRLYVRYAGTDDIRVDSDGFDPTVWEKGTSRRNLVRQPRQIGAALGVLVLIVIGWAASSELADSGGAQKNFTIMAHRGDVGSGVENTLGAFEGAIAAGADYIELDILQTKDHKLAVIHDENLKRLSGQNVNVFDLTLEELQRIQLRENGFKGHVSSLDEVIEFAKGRIRLNIELKTHGHESKDYVRSFIETIRRHHVENNIIVQSLEYKLVQEVKELAPDLKVGYIIYATFAPVERFNADFFVIEESFATPRLIATAHLADKPLYVWTVNAIEQVERFYTLGVNGIITDIPAEARETVKLLSNPDNLTERIINY